MLVRRHRLDRPANGQKAMYAGPVQQVVKMRVHRQQAKNVVGAACAK